jgi:ABC-type phosphate transport system substrate-binding protein
VTRLEDRLRRDLRAQAEHLTPRSVPRLRLPGSAGHPARTPWHRGPRRWPAWVTPLAAAAAVTAVIVGTFTAIVAIPLGTAAAPARTASQVPPAGATRYVPISGSGTDWTTIAISRWAGDVRSRLVVSYNPDGSAAGRADYMANRDDFAASDPPFRSGVDKLGGVGPQHPVQGYSYIPDAAGGTAFVYHITMHGHRLTSLRLSPATLMGIFTGTITNWDSPLITRDNGHRLPNLPITPVIPSDGDGGTYFFTHWLAYLFPRQWNAFCDRVHPGIRPPCGGTEFYPQFGNAKAEPGSDNVLAYINSTYGNGAIGYLEYSYALNSDSPVVQVLNPAGKYVLPTSANVTTALTRAVINFAAHSRNYLQQNLTKVYTYANPRSYPLASYSYLIVPREGTRLPTIFTKAKGRALSAFVTFALCQGQRQLSQLGYAPLPSALVRGGLQQAARIPGHGPIPSPAHCR